MSIFLGAVKTTKSKYTKDFMRWFNSDNVIKVAPNMYASQDAQYRNRMTKAQALKYFIREFRS